MRNLREPLGNGDIIECPSIANLTVTANGQTGAAPQAISTAVLSLNANLHPAIFAALPEVDSFQLMDGSWAGLVAEDSLVQLKNYMDEQLLRNYIAQSLCWDTGASYVTNPAGDSLTDDDVLSCKAALLAQDGVRQQNLALFVSPYGEGSLANISSFVPPMAMASSGTESMHLGIPMVGSVSGVPVYSTNSVLRNHTVATTAAVTTGTGVTHTYTVAAGHGLLPGMLVTVSGHDADENIATPTAITSVTATTVVVTTAATADGTSTDATGTISCAHSFNVMLDRSQVFVAQQKMPKLRLVDDYDSTDTALQVSSLWGRIGRAGRARLLMSPGAAV